jgi:uncharacterized damage-inducible protein DinB
MKLSQTLLPEFDQEMANTRRVLERVPEDQIGWKPHEKSMTLGRLATHVAELAGWAAFFLKGEFLDLAAMDYKPHVASSRQELLELFDSNVAESRAAIEATEDPAFRELWTLRKGDHVIFTLPRVAVMRSMLLNHLIHHRGQLTVYLRLTGIPVPGLYGPSADEQ